MLMKEVANDMFILQYSRYLKNTKIALVKNKDVNCFRIHTDYKNGK